MSVPGSASPLFLATAAAAAPAGFRIDRSLRFSSSDSAYLSKSFSSAGNRKKWTWSGWLKRTGTGTTCLFSAQGSSNHTLITFYGSTQKFAIIPQAGQAGATFQSNDLHRDPSAWYHFVIALDTTQSTASNRLKVYKNGVEMTWSSSTYPSQNEEWNINIAGAHNIGRTTQSDSYLDGYLTEIHFVDGTALAASDFGEPDSNGVWQPKDCKDDLTYGTNGFYLKFADNSSKAALGTDSSGNSNTWTVNNLTASGSSAVSVIDLDGNDSIEYPGPGDGISGDFTMECFFLMNSSASGFQRIFSTKEGSYSDEQTMIRRKSDGNIQFYAGNSSPADHTGGSITANVWHHAAIVRSGSTVSYYYDGSRLSTDSYSSSFDITKLVVGGGYGSENFDGDVHGARFTNGQALYTGSSYTVPTSGITTTSQGATASNVKVLAGTTSTVNENAGTLGNGTSSGDPTATTAAVFGNARDTDSLLDTPTNYAADSGNNGGNYATLNSISHVGRDCTFSNGNLDVVVGDGFGSTNNDGIRAVSTIGMTSGKWYFEHEITGGSVARSNVGVLQDITTVGFGGNHWIGSRSTDYIVWSHSGEAYNAGSASSYGVSWTTGDIIGCAFDADNGNLYVYKNGTVMNSGTAAFTGLTNGPYYFVCSEKNSNISANFGQRSFQYTPPTGYVSLCTQNLSESAYASIPDGSTAFDVELYTGNASTQSITGLNFSPDLVWLKQRSASNSHFLLDVVRGFSNGSALELRSNGTNAEGVPSTASTGLTSFDNNGFSIGSDSGINANNGTFIAWAWDAGTSTASNTDGSITSSVRASQANGFSIATYTGNGTENSTVGHGLNAAPSVVIIKNRSSAYAWAVLHTSAGTTGTTLDGSAEYYMLQLNSTAARNDFTNDNIWNPTNSTFKINGEGTGNWVNKSGDNYVAYSWAPVAGYSAFGSYLGTGTTDGPFVYTGFRPAFVIRKRTDAAGGGWYLIDTDRDTYNEADAFLDAADSDQEASGTGIDVLSNGFKLRNSAAGSNASGGTYVYMAWAEHPFRTARAR